MIGSLFAAIKREFDVMVKGKMIFIVIIIIPLLANLLLGYEFNKDVLEKIPMAVYDADNSSLSRMVVEQFRQNQMFDIKYYSQNSDDIKALMDDSKIRVGMIIPNDFNKDVLETKSPSVLMVYDGSHMPIAAAAKKSASEILLTLKTGVFIKALEGKLNLPADMAKKVALAISFNNRTLYNPAGSYKNFLNIGLGTAIVQSAIAIMAATAIRSSEMEKEKSKRLGYLLGKVVFYGLIGWLSMLMSIFIQYKIFNIPFRGKLLEAAMLSIMLTFAVSAFGIMVSAWIRDNMISTLINSVIFVPNTIMVGYTWPVLSMPRPYQTVANFYPFYHYVGNLRDMFLKGLSISKMNGDIIWFVKFILAVLVIGSLGIFIIKSDKHIKKASSGKEGDGIVIS